MQQPAQSNDLVKLTEKVEVSLLCEHESGLDAQLHKRTSDRRCMPVPKPNNVANTPKRSGIRVTKRQ